MNSISHTVTVCMDSMHCLSLWNQFLHFEVCFHCSLSKRARHVLIKGRGCLVAPVLMCHNVLPMVSLFDCHYQLSWQHLPPPSSAIRPLCVLLPGWHIAVVSIDPSCKSKWYMEGNFGEGWSLQPEVLVYTLWLYGHLGGALLAELSWVELKCWSTILRNGYPLQRGSLKSWPPWI